MQANKGWFINKVNPKEIHFAKTKGDAGIEKGQSLQLILFNTAQQLVYQKPFTAIEKGKLTISIPPLSAGIYALSLQAGKTMISGQISLSR